MAPKKPPTSSTNDTISISQIEAEKLRVPIVGTSPYIQHRFSEKAKRQMLDNMLSRKNPKQNKDPEAEYLAAFYRCKDAPLDTDEGPFGIPVISFKLATKRAGRFYSQVTMTELQQSLFFRGEIGADNTMLARINGTPHMREDVVRVNRGGADLRYRPEFTEWSTELEVTFVKSMLTRDSVLSLIDAGGLGVGVGEWRPEKGGDFGCYRIDPTRKVEAVS